MGRDIHCYIEYADGTVDGKKFWSSFGLRFNPGRNYTVFGRITSVSELVPLRGFPADAGHAARSDNILYVSNDIDDDKYCTREQAERWGGHYVDETKSTCFHPDWHGHTWLTFEEWAQATEGAGPEYSAMSGAMETLDTQGHECRVIIWFDN